MRLKSCFGCFSLQTGTVAIGSISLAGSIFSAISALLILDDFGDRIEGPSVFTLKSFFTGLLIYVLVIGVMDGLMIYGAQNRNPDYVFPWLAIATTELLICISISLGLIITVSMMFPIKWLFVVLAICTICIVIHSYIWLIVYSFYKQLTVEKYGDAMIPMTKNENLDQLKNVYHNV